MSHMIETLQYSSRLVKMWGQSHLPDGRTLSEALTLDRIPFWEAFAVELARIYVPAALSAEASPSDITRMVRPYLIRAKYGLRDFIRDRHSTNGCSAWPTGHIILCLGFIDYIYRDILQPVAIRLVERPEVKVVSLSDKAWQKANPSPHQNVLYQTVWEHWNQQVALQVSKLKRALDRTEKDLRTSNMLSSIVRDGGQCLWGQFENVFDRFFRADLPLLVRQAAVARHILEDHRPALVISPDVADPRTRVYTLICRQMGIPCIEVQFGLAGDEGIEWRFFSADNVAALGETSKEALLKHGIPTDKIIITGSPRHDSLVNNVPDTEMKSKRANLGVPEKCAMVLLASAYQLTAYDEYSSPELLCSMKRSVFEAADNTPGIFLVVKPHPLEDVNETRALAGKSKNIIFVSQKSDIRELTRICDAFVSFGSTSTADALISGKLTICPVFPGWVWSDLYKNSGATLVPTSAAEVLEIFRFIANGAHGSAIAKLEPARQNFLSQWVYRADGLAAERVAKLVLQTAQINIRIPH
jgi:hypothetical protein